MYIYVVSSGEYSDRTNEGYFESEEDAKKYCVAKNSTEKYRLYSYEKVEKIKLEYDKNSFCYEIKIKIVNDVFKIYDYNLIFADISQKKNYITSQDTMHIFIKDFDIKNEKNVNLVLKIAYDLYAKYKSEL